MNVADWPADVKAAYLACAIDTDGWISLWSHLNAGVQRLTPTVGVTNVSTEFLERIVAITGFVKTPDVNGKTGSDARGIRTNAPVWQMSWRSPLQVVPILEQALPFLVVKRERAEWVLEYARTRINPATGLVYRSGRPYTERDLELCSLVTAANGKRQADTAA